MIKLQGKLPKSFFVAVSGGPDSMGALDFLRRKNPNIQCAFFNHGTEFSENGQEFVTKYCLSHSIPLTVGNISRERMTKESIEEYWRNERLSFFHSLNLPVITAHHLDDCVEEWIINSIVRGKLGVIPFQNNNILRPFRLTSKQDFVDWCCRHNVEYLQDSSNFSDNFLRGKIRNRTLAALREINPGLKTLVKKYILSENRLVA